MYRKASIRRGFSERRKKTKKGSGYPRTTIHTIQYREAILFQSSGVLRWRFGVSVGFSLSVFGSLACPVIRIISSSAPICLDDTFLAGADATVHRQEGSAYWLGFGGEFFLEAMEHSGDAQVIGGEGGGIFCSIKRLSEVAFLL